MPSKFAKAASVMHHTWGVIDFNQAVEIYDEVNSTLGPVMEVLDKHEVGVWQDLDHLSPEDWWGNVVALSEVIDTARQYFEGDE